MRAREWLSRWAENAGANGWSSRAGAANTEPVLQPIAPPSFPRSMLALLWPCRAARPAWLAIPTPSLRSTVQCWTVDSLEGASASWIEMASFRPAALLASC